MIISKRTVVLSGIVCIFIFAFLNRMHVFQQSEMVNAYYTEDKYTHTLYYTYKGVSYKSLMENTAFLENNSACKLLIINENPKKIVVFNFMGFWFVALAVSCVVVLAWLLFAQVFFEKIDYFTLSFGKRKKNDKKHE